MSLFNHGVSNVQPRNILKLIKVDKTKIIEVIIVIQKLIITLRKFFQFVGKASVDMGNTALSLLKNFENEISEGG